MRRFIKIFLLLITTLIVLVGAIGSKLSEPGYQGPKSDHFDGEVFHNQVRNEREFSNFFKWIINRTPGSWDEENQNNEYVKPPSRIDGESARITFVNHSTFLIQVDGLNILTDPIWSERASPFSFVGPVRARSPGLSFDELPKIDVVVISHNHYDHMDIDTLTRLFERDKPRFLFGLGNGGLFDNNDIKGFTELDWWQEYKVSDDITVASVPAQHFSGRGLADRNETLWMGFVIKSSVGNIYFAGDTGFGPHFKEIGERYAPIRTALLPIGAFVPKWFMGYVHVSPEEAVKAAQTLNAQTSIGMHFGTFRLADDAQNEPLEKLEDALREIETPPDFRVLDFGESLIVE